MGAPKVEEDAKRVFEVLKAGGIAVAPASMGYTLMTSDAGSLEKIFTTKKRGAHKRHAMGGSFELHQAIHDMKPRDAEIVRCLTQDFDLPLGVIAKFKQNHPMINKIDETTMDATSVNGTLAMLINAGRFQDELTKLTMAENLPYLGSSANISTTGTKYVVEDIPQELLNIADIVIDYGVVEYGFHGRSSTMIDFSGPTPEVVRIGICYDVIRDHLQRFWGIKTPEDPGKASLPSGHLKNLPPLQSLEKLIATY